MKRRALIVVAALAAALIVAPAALANGGFTLKGGATAENGHVKLVSNLSDTGTTNDASWIDFDVPSGLTFSKLETLAVEYSVTDDGCGGGSPRFQINVGGKNVFVYLGPSPSFTGCTLGTWLSSGNLVGTSDQCRVDTSQLSPGTQCTTWAAAVALLGSQTVTGIQLVTDGGWFFTDKEQTVLVRKVVINGRTYVKPGTSQSKGNPAKACKAQREAMGPAAFNELWGKNWNSRNAFGKCVSAMARAKQGGTMDDAQEAIMDALSECKAEGLRGARLGACVSERDGLVATKNDPAGKGKGKGKNR